MLTNKLYKQRYCIAEYNADDELLHIFDGVQEMADYYGCTYKQARARLEEHLQYGTRFFLIDMLALDEDCFFDADVDTIRTMFPRP